MAVPAVWSRAASAQETNRQRRVGLLIGFPENDPLTKIRIDALIQELHKLGWVNERNIRFDFRYSPANSSDEAGTLARELLALRPDAVLAVAPQLAAAAKRETQTVPVIFLGVPDPIGLGLVASLPRPGGNVTGVLTYEESIAGKWLAMLREIDPALARVGLVGNPKTTAFDYFLRTTKEGAASLNVEVLACPVATAADIQDTLESLARGPNTGIVLPPDSSTIAHAGPIVTLAARHRLPAVYSFRLFVAAGGLMSYGVDFVEMFKQGAPYVDRILRGTKPADLPVQAPAKFETALNLKAAKALGLPVPSTLLVRADEVIE